MICISKQPLKQALSNDVSKSKKKNYGYSVLSFYVIMMKLVSDSKHLPPTQFVILVDGLKMDL
jgi:hypothetical protein